MFTEPTNSCRTISDLRDILEEYKQELRHYSETSYNKVVALKTNPVVTTSVDSLGEIKIGSFLHPSKFTDSGARNICLKANTKLGEYSKCEIVPYKKWLMMRVNQLSQDLGHLPVKN